MDTVGLTPLAFVREGRAIATLNHPNICTLLEVGTDDGRLYVVMELLTGASLHQILASGPLSMGALVDHAVAVADALHAAHTRGMIHRNLNPTKVFLTERGTILDFGLSKAASDALGEWSRDSALVIGPMIDMDTVSYLSPEQVSGGDVYTRTDLFSLGMVLYEMATGKRAFGGQTVPERLGPF